MSSNLGTAAAIVGGGIAIGAGIAFTAGCVAALPVAGKFALSFFSPAMASAVGSYGTAASLGLLALIPDFFIRLLLWKDYTAPKSDTAAVIIASAAYLGAALMLGTPLIPSIACGVILPTMWLAFKLIIKSLETVSEIFEPSYHRQP